MKKKLLLFLLPFVACGEWNSHAISLASVLQNTESNWHYLNWFGAYYQTESGWIHHHRNGWMYPQIANQGTWFYWNIIGEWIWTRWDLYPLAWDSFTETWFQIDLSIHKNFDQFHTFSTARRLPDNL